MANNIPSFVDFVAQREGIDPGLAHRVISAESGGNPNAVSPKGATGLMQLMPATAKELGVTDSRDPVQNIEGGLHYLGQQKQRFGSDEQALAAYNAGPSRVARGGELPLETQAYVKKITGGGQQQQVPSFAEFVKSREQSAPAEQASAEEEPSLMGFLNNVVNSGGKAAMGMANTVLHPIDTAKGLGHVVTHPGELVDLYKQRYGGFDNIKKTLYEDPVGAALDISTVLGGLGTGAKLAGFGDTARMLSTAGELTNPLMLPAKAAEHIGVSRYASTLKPSRTLIKGAETAGFNNAKDFARFGLENGINITNKGADKADRIAEAASQAVEGNVSRAAQAGEAVRPQAVTSTIPDLIAKVEKDINPEAKVAAANESAQEFLRKFIDPKSAPQPRVQVGMGTVSKGAQPMGPLNVRDIPIDELHDIKKTSYQYTPSNAWTSDAVPPAMREARMAITKRAKELIEEKTAGYENGGPTTHDANQKYAQARKVEEAITQRQAHPGGLTRHIGELLGGTAIGHPLLGLLLELLDTPGNQSRLARTLYAAPSAARVAAPVTAVQRALQD